MPKRLALLCSLAALACATAEPAPQPKQAWRPEPARPAAPQVAGVGGPAVVEGAPPAPAPGPVTLGDLGDPKAYAARFVRPETCEQAARNAHTLSQDRGWEVLKACIQKGNFTLIRRLLDGAWDQDLQTRADAGIVLAAVVAARGGDVAGDLNFLRQKRVPIFALGPAASHPDVYKGRLLLMRVRVDDVKTERQQVTVRLSEMAMGAQVSYVEGDTRRKESSSERESASFSGKYADRGSSSKNGSWSQSGSRSGQASYARDASKTSGYETRRVDNMVAETGVEALGRLSRIDPFFEPGRQFVVLARFDGLRDLPSEEGDTADQLPLVSIITYAEPSPNVVE